MTTQFVVGAVGESDLELLSTTESLYKRIGLARAYYSAFNPVSDTPFENQPPASSIREHRLYQASFLLRDYGFDLEDIPFESSGNLPLDEDPKLAWAKKHLSESPMEINRASQHELLRIPGIGLKGAKAILTARLRSNLRELEDLHKIGINHLRAAPFILLDGKRPSRQMSFW
jgi:predicted DNA-binding helix-hairpin-helix protein